MSTSKPNEQTGATKDLGRREPVFASPGMKTFPVCPHCGIDPAVLNANMANIGKFMCLVVFCANLHCRRIVTVEVIGELEPRVVAPGGNGRIVIPGN
jgi:hypothetical protein